MAAENGGRADGKRVTPTSSFPRGMDLDYLDPAVITARNSRASVSGGSGASSPGVDPDDDSVTLYTTVSSLNAAHAASHLNLSPRASSAEASPGAMAATRIVLLDSATVCDELDKVHESQRQASLVDQAFASAEQPIGDMANIAKLECVGIVGASGAVGKEMIACLDKRNFPVKKVRLFARRSAGQVVQTEHFGELTIEPFSVEAAQTCEIVLLAVSGSFSTEHAYNITGGPKNTVVIDNSSAFRYHNNVPLVVPEINGRHARGEMLIANPNCTTAIAAMVLWPIHMQYGLRKVIMSTYQASSGAGAEGMEELIAGVKHFAADGTVPAPTVFQHQLPFNVIPHIDAFQANGYTKEEMKVSWEMRKIFEMRDNVKISCTAVRTPTLRAHSESIVLETVKPIAAADVRALLASAPGVRVVDNPEENIYPMPLTASGRDAVDVGRIRQSLVFGEKGIELFVCGDQLLRGAALNAVLIAERVAAQHCRPRRTTRTGDDGDDNDVPIVPMLGPVPWELHKFGGSALAGAENYRMCGNRTVAESTRLGKQFPTAVVVSATEGMTDELINVTRVAHQQGGLPTALALLNAAVDRQVAIIHSLLGTATPTQAGAAGNAPAEDRAASAMGTEKRAELIDAVVASIHRDRDNVAGLLRGLSLLRSVNQATQEYIAGLGEVWSAATLTAYITSTGTPAAMLDARDVLVVEPNLTSLSAKGMATDATVEPLYEESARRLEAWWRDTACPLIRRLTPPSSRVSSTAVSDDESGGHEGPEGHPPHRRASQCNPVVVITGFVASSKDGAPTTLKRSGSDFSATIFACLLKAQTVTLWKTVNGVYTADPRCVPSAFSVPALTYDEATELAYFGGEVLHPSAMLPCIENQITILVRNVLEPSFAGTMITDMEKTTRALAASRGPLASAQQALGILAKTHRTAASPDLTGETTGSAGGSLSTVRYPVGAVKVVTSMNNIALVDVQAGSYASVAKVGRRAMKMLDAAAIRVVLITQASAEHSMTIAVDEASADVAVSVLRQAFELELVRGEFLGVRNSKGFALLTVVGPMAGVKGTLMKLTRGISSTGANIFAVAQGSSERSISVIVKRSVVKTVLREVHDEFLGKHNLGLVHHSRSDRGPMGIGF